MICAIKTSSRCNSKYILPSLLEVNDSSHIVTCNPNFDLEVKMVAHPKMFSSLKFDYRGLFLTRDTSTSITKESHVLLREIEVNYSCLEISCVVQSYAFYVILKSYTYEVTYFISWIWCWISFMKVCCHRFLVRACPYCIFLTILLKVFQWFDQKHSLDGCADLEPTEKSEQIMAERSPLSFGRNDTFGSEVNSELAIKV